MVKKNHQKIEKYFVYIKNNYIFAHNFPKKN